MVWSEGRYNRSADSTGIHDYSIAQVVVGVLDRIRRYKSLQSTHFYRVFICGVQAANLYSSVRFLFNKIKMIIVSHERHDISWLPSIIHIALTFLAFIQSSEASVI
jgi:hypothetical protein